MRADLEELLRETAVDPEPVDLEEVRRDAHRLRRNRRVAALGGAAGAAAVVAIAILTVTGAPEPPVIGPGPSPPDAIPTTEPSQDLPAADGWEALPAGPVDGRTFPAVVWTGDELLVWGGEEAQDRGTATGALFDPVAGTWRPTAPAPLGPKTAHAAVWTGEEAIICCGRGSGTAAYDPATDTWRELAAGPRAEYPVAVWTGEQMIVTGGVQRGGASVSTETHIYDPSADVWIEGASVPVVLERAASAVWTGEQMFVWASYDDDHTGWAYDPTADAWTALPAPPVDFMSPSLAWSGTALFVVGAGRDVNEQLLAAAYEPATQRWQTLDPDLPTPRGAEGNQAGQAAVWTGEELYVWSGYLGTGLTDEGSVLVSYDPATHVWQHHPPAPVLGWRPDLAWTQHGLFVIDPEAYLGYAPERLATAQRLLDPATVEVLTAAQTADRTLKGHVVTDQDGLESVWEMFDTRSPAPPSLPEGSGALVVAADGCHALQGVTGVEIRDSIGIVLVEEDQRVSRADCDRTVFAVAIPADIADRLTGADAAVQQASSASSPHDQSEEPAVHWWHRTLGGGGVSDHGHWAVANQDTVFTVDGTRATELVAVDLASGDERWQKPIDSRWSGLPQVATDDVVIVSAQYRDVYALDTATGDTVWTLELDDGYGAASATVVGDDLLLVADSHAEGDYRPPRVLAVDLADGAVRWETELRPGESVQWAPPIAVDGRIAVATSPDGQQEHSGVHVLDVNTGELQWTRDVGPAREYTSYTEVVAHVTGNLLHLPLPGPATATLNLDTAEVLWESEGAWPLGGSQASLVMTDGQSVYTVDPATGETLSEPRALQLVDKADWLISIDATDTVVAPTIDGIAILDPTTGRTSELHPTGVPLNRVIIRGGLLVVATQDRGVLTIDLNP